MAGLPFQRVGPEIRSCCIRRTDWYDEKYDTLLDSRIPSTDRAGTIGMNPHHSMLPNT